ncbi:MAG: isochorismate synthase [Armatimonadota bacterium]|nr:isochorismate synthase [Armatimonadota bacterium]MDW8156066.1 isochorismate synthase [Armatimonadota bacterium]
MGTSVWAAGEAWTVELAGPGRFGCAASRWRELAVRAVWEGPLRPVAFAGFAFGEGQTAGLWEGFPDGLLSVPRVLRVRVLGREYVALACVATPQGDEEEAERTVGLLDAVGQQHGEPPVRAEVVRWLPPDGRWRSQVQAAEAACRSGHLEKVVVARCVELSTSASEDAALRSLSTRYPTCTAFAVSRPQGVFLGATPEVLARVRRGRVWTQALAGTAPRGSGRRQDGLLRAQLLASPKEAREHELVAAHLRQALADLCRDVRERPREVVALPNVHHLRTRFSGRLNPGLGLLEVAGRLHPTPAVAGLPVPDACAWVRENESLPRGWYAGAVGWVDFSGQGELVVAIRSALVRDGRAWAFAGCGVVAGADPDREVRESQLKLQPVLEALGVRAR